ncbi:LPS ABC transporter substrate-binding protein LptA [Salmonella enterica subsp. enterica serovar Virchow]|nr:LPS ABC transporter substrate-binding protein LptA [Salmonella enterica subsp. enterica serovar Virchow]EBW2353358.1 LPS ABC transporter substrate-binding protein LptA [Salmonella enterica subsp. enterica serovar Enteritidis]MIL09701.1 LPS ABC transporter substrate-binding protein LptA [Salmonella enterica subsp. enterica serovar Enteritidis]
MGAEMAMLLRATGVALALTMGFGASVAHAQQDVRSRLSGLKLSGDQPIQIESDRLEVDEGNSKATFIGNVSVAQGPTTLKAGRMTVFYARDGQGGKAPAGNSAGAASAATNANIDRLEVDGTVLIKSDKQTATGERGTFDMKSQVLTLSGKTVTLSEGPNVLQGCKLTVQMQSGQARFEGCGGRVKTLLTPGSQNQ